MMRIGRIKTVRLDKTSLRRGSIPSGRWKQVAMNGMMSVLFSLSSLLGNPTHSFEYLEALAASSLLKSSCLRFLIL